MSVRKSNRPRRPQHSPQQSPQHSPKPRQNGALNKRHSGGSSGIPDIDPVEIRRWYEHAINLLTRLNATGHLTLTDVERMIGPYRTIRKRLPIIHDDRFIPRFVRSAHNKDADLLFMAHFLTRFYDSIAKFHSAVTNGNKPNENVQAYVKLSIPQDEQIATVLEKICQDDRLGESMVASIRARIAQLRPNARQRGDAERQRRAQEEARQRGDAERQRRAQEEARQRGEAERQRRAQEEARQRGDAERRAQTEAGGYWFRGRVNGVDVGLSRTIVNGEYACMPSGSAVTGAIVRIFRDGLAREVMLALNSRSQLWMFDGLAWTQIPTEEAFQMLHAHRSRFHRTPLAEAIAREQETRYESHGNYWFRGRVNGVDVGLTTTIVNGEYTCLPSGSGVTGAMLVIDGVMVMLVLNSRSQLWMFDGRTWTQIPPEQAQRVRRDPRLRFHRTPLADAMARQS